MLFTVGGTLQQFCLVSDAEDTSTRSIAEATGGSVARSDQYDGAQVVKKLRSFHSLITRVYRVEVSLPQVVDTPRPWRLEVMDAKGQKLKKVQLVYPRLLVPAPASK